MKRNVIKKFTATVMASTFFFLAGIGLLPFGRKVLADSFNPGIEAFVNSLYADCLGRNADQTGFSDWCNKLASGQITGKQAAYGFFFSSEFIAKANAWSDDQLIEAYYRVFLNRSSDPAGKAYWSQQIAGTTNDVSILFTGFADSAEFASKCASYGIMVGSHVDVPTTTRGAASGGSPSVGGTVSADGLSATTPEALDIYWTSQGFEIYYIDLGNGQTQKCYAQFYDMTNHNNMVNAWRNQNGLPSYNILTDLNDPRVQRARLRAVECAYSFSHTPPIEWYIARTMGVGGDEACGRAIAGNAGENIANGTSSVNSIDTFRNSSLHNIAMLATDVSSMSTAACRVAFVRPDGVSIYTNSSGNISTPTELPGYNGGLPAGTAMAAVQCFWE